MLLVADDVVRDPRRFVEQLAGVDVRRLVAVPSYLAALLDQVPDLGRRLPGLRWLTSSG